MQNAIVFNVIFKENIIKNPTSIMPPSSSSVNVTEPAQTQATKDNETANIVPHSEQTVPVAAFQAKPEEKK